MAADQSQVEVYVESGQKRALAVALDWPGWCRSANDEASALEALLGAASRYAAILQSTGLRFRAPERLDQLRVSERVTGNASTDMAVPAVILAGDARPMSEAEVQSVSRVLTACWQAFDRTTGAASGRELRKGPRGGGRELEGIARHVLEAESAYADRIGLKLKWGDLADMADVRKALAASREACLEGLASIALLGTPPPGPRGGARWPARYFVRRVAYHVVDHTWEIEDRLQTPK